MEFTKKQDLKCIYCGESQECPAIDVIPYVPNMWGYGKTEHQTGVHDWQCGNCDQVFYLSLVEDNKIATANLPSKLYNY